MIKKPDFDDKKEGKRASIEALAQLSGPTAALARLYHSTHPSHNEIETRRFLEEVADTINLLELTTCSFQAGGLRENDFLNVSSVTDCGNGIKKVNLASTFEANDYTVIPNSETGSRFAIENKTPDSFEIHKLDGDMNVDFSFSFTASGDFAKN